MYSIVDSFSYAGCETSSYRVMTMDIMSAMTVSHKTQRTWTKAIKNKSHKNSGGTLCESPLLMIVSGFTAISSSLSAVSQCGKHVLS